MKPKKYNQNTKIKCDECEKLHRTKNTIRFKGKYICWECRQKRKTTSMMKKVPMMFSLKEALDKTYKVIIGFSGDGKYAHCNCYFPKILAGKKFKITLEQ